MLGHVIHKKQVQAQIPAMHYGRDWGVRRKLHTWTSYKKQCTSCVPLSDQGCQKEECTL